MNVKALIRFQGKKFLVSVSCFDTNSLLVLLNNNIIRISKKEVIKYIK